MSNGHLEYLDVRMRAADPRVPATIERARAAIAELRERGYRVACDRAERLLMEMINGSTQEEDEADDLYWQRAEEEFKSWVEIQNMINSIGKRMEDISILSKAELKRLQDDLISLDGNIPDWLTGKWGRLKPYFASLSDV